MEKNQERERERMQSIVWIQLVIFSKIGGRDFLFAACNEARKKEHENRLCSSLHFDIHSLGPKLKSKFTSFSSQMQNIHFE